MKIHHILTIYVVSLLGFIFSGCKDPDVKLDPKINPTDTTTVKKPVYVGKSYYVSSLIGSESYNALTPTTPCKNITTAANVAVPGDTIFIMNGAYTSSFNITKSGTKDRYITYKAYSGHKPKISNLAAQWNLIVISASFIVFDGIELEGNNQNLTIEGATLSYQHWIAGQRIWDEVGVYNCNAISVNGDATKGFLPTHVIIRNCKVHDFSGGGIGSGLADYVTFENNVVYNNAWYTQWACSGMGCINPFNSDNSTGYKMIFRNNICYNNKDLIPWVDLTPNRLSDGNGIIIDINKTTVSTVGGTPIAYTGRTLVENNVSFNNGGSGIHAYGSSHVDIFNNTAFNNGTVVGYADIYASDASDVRIVNNIMYARSGGKCNTNGGNTSVTYDYNIYFNGSTETKGPHDKYADPMFINASNDGAVANFSLIPGSPAINYGYTGFAPKFDILGVARPKGGTADCGAYEVQ